MHAIVEVELRYTSCKIARFIIQLHPVEYKWRQLSSHTHLFGVFFDNFDHLPTQKELNTYEHIGK